MRRAALLSGLFLFGCTQRPELIARLTRADLDRSFDERMSFLLNAPTIVVGRVVRVKEIGVPLPAQFDPRVRVQLNEISLNTELVLRGDSQPTPLRLHYFTFSHTSTVELGQYDYYPMEGSRRIFFLDETDGSYRSVADVLDYTLPVRSGYHAPEFCDANLPPGCCIARLLLTPGRDMNEEALAEEVGEDWGVAREMCSQQEANALLRTLAESSSGQLEKRARWFLTSSERTSSRPW